MDLMGSVNAYQSGAAGDRTGVSGTAILAGRQLLRSQTGMVIEVWGGQGNLSVP